MYRNYLSKWFDLNSLDNQQCVMGNVFPADGQKLLPVWVPVEGSVLNSTLLLWKTKTLRFHPHYNNFEL